MHEVSYILFIFSNNIRNTLPPDNVEEAEGTVYFSSLKAGNFKDVFKK